MPFEGKKMTHPNGLESVAFGPVGLFGERINPETGKTFFHSGIDVVPTNDTIRAPYSGLVSGISFGQTTGIRLVITHDDGLETTYGHLAEILVAGGATVEGGQPIAIVGNTGKSTGKHLHLETRVDGELTDPLETLFGIKVSATGTATDKMFISISRGTKKTP